MTLTAPSRTVATGDKGRLAAGISASATTITVGPIFKTVDGVRTKQGFDSTAGECIISQGDFLERISFEGSSVDATTKVTTLTSCTRGLPVTNTTANFTGGTGRAWPKGAAITVVDAASYNQSMVLVNATNTFTGSGAIRSSSTTTPLVRLNSVTTAQRTGMSASNGDMVYDSDLGQFYKYEAGAWAAIATGSFSNAANNTAGKVDLATAAEVAAGTANDATSGAPNVIPVSIVKPNSTGAVSGSVVALNSSVMLDGTIGGIGAATPATGRLLLGAGAGVAMTTIGPGTAGQVPVSNGTTLAMGTAGAFSKVVYASTTDSSTAGAGGTFDTHTYTIPANDLVAGVWYVVECGVNVSAANGAVGIITKLGSTSLSSPTGAGSSTTGTGLFRSIIRGTAAAGASVAVECDSTLNYAAVSGASSESANVATNGTLAITLVANPTTSCTMKLTSMTVTKWSSSMFT